MSSLMLALEDQLEQVLEAANLINEKHSNGFEEDMNFASSDGDNSSIDSISSIDEKGCEFLYKGDHKSRFEALKILR